MTSLHELSERHHEVHLDLSGVSYCDLAGLRAEVASLREELARA